MVQFFAGRLRSQYLGTGLWNERPPKLISGISNSAPASSRDVDSHYPDISTDTLIRPNWYGEAVWGQLSNSTHPACSSSTELNHSTSCCVPWKIKATYCICFTGPRQHFARDLFKDCQGYTRNCHHGRDFTKRQSVLSSESWEGNSTGGSKIHNVSTFSLSADQQEEAWNQASAGASYSSNWFFCLLPGMSQQ